MCIQITWEPCENADSDPVGLGRGLRLLTAADAAGPETRLVMTKWWKAGRQALGWRGCERKEHRQVVATKAQGLEMEKSRPVVLPGWLRPCGTGRRQSWKSETVGLKGLNFTATGKGKNFKGRKKHEVKLEEFTDLWNPGNTSAKTIVISSAGKESTCNVGDPRSIPGMGRFPGEEIGYPLQYSWAALAAQVVKNSPAMREDLGSIPGLGRSTWAWQHTPVFLPGESPWTEEPGGLQSMGSQSVGHDWVTEHAQFSGSLDRTVKSDSDTSSAKPSYGTIFKLPCGWICSCSTSDISQEWESQPKMGYWVKGLSIC